MDHDICELVELARFEPAGFVDLGKLAKEIGMKNHGLRGLAAVVLGFRIPKTARTSNWAKDTLTPAQIKYAATDAWIGRELYKKIQQEGSLSEAEASPSGAEPLWGGASPAHFNDGRWTTVRFALLRLSSLSVIICVINR